MRLWPLPHNICGMPSRSVAAVLGLVGMFACAKPAPPPSQPFTLVEATIPQMREAMEQGRLTSHQLVEMYLAQARHLSAGAQGRDLHQRERVEGGR